MNRWLPPLLALSLVGCLAERPAPVSPLVAAKRTTIAPSPQAEATASPEATSTPAPTPTPSPRVPMRLVTGLVSVDAHYLLANNGASLISDKGLGLITSASAGLIVVDGRPIPVGGGLISNNGGSALARYGLFAQNGVSLGQVLPVQGMGVVALSLLTGEPVSEAVRSDAEGRFSLAVPEALAENVRLVAKVPTAKADDPLQQDARLAYEIVVSPSAPTGPGEINEDTRIATRFMRESAADKIAFLLGVDDAGLEAELFDPNMDPAAQLLMRQIVDELRQAVTDAGVPATALSALSRRVLDAGLAYVNLDGIVIDRQNTIWKSAPEGTKALPALAETLADIREAATLKMQAQADYFVARPYMLKANQRRAAAGLPPYVIKRPSDFVDFVYDEYIADNSVRFDDMAPVLEDLGLTAQEDGKYLVHLKLSAGGKSIFGQIALTMFTRPDAKRAVLALIADAGR